MNTIYKKIVYFASAAMPSALDAYGAAFCADEQFAWTLEVVKSPCDEHDNTPLHIAAWASKSTLFLRLAEMWPDGMRVVNKHGEIPFACWLDSWNHTPENEKLVMDFMEREAASCFNYVNRHTRKTTLMLAAASGKTESVGRLLSRVNIDAQDDSNFTALAWAAYWDRPIVIKRLLEAGANTELVTSFLGHTAREIAVAMGSDRAVRVLLKDNSDMRTTAKRAKAL